MERDILWFSIFNFVFLGIVIVGTYKLYNYILKKNNKDAISFPDYINQGKIPP